MMRNYATEAYGLVLSSEEAFDAIKKYAKETGEELGEDVSVWDVYDIGECLGLNLYGNLEAEAFVIDDNGMDDCCSGDYIEESAFVLELKRYPSLFSQAYKTKEEAIEELKSSDIAKYLPEDFDYNDHFRHLIGNSFG